MLRILLIGILLLVIARTFWRVMDGVIEAAGGQRRTPRARQQAVKLMRDPVCGTFVSPGSAVSSTSGETTTYFCSEKCRDDYRDSRQ